MTCKDALERRKCWVCQYATRTVLPQCEHPERHGDECPGWEPLGTIQEEEV